MAADTLIDTFRHLSQEMAGAARAAAAIHHRGRQGTQREQLVEAHLLKFLPERYAIGRGEVRSTDATWSRDEDLLVYERLVTPKLFAGHDSLILPVDGLAAVVEVKSNMRSADVQTASETIASVKRLKKSAQQFSMTGAGMTWSAPRPPFGAVFAFGLAISPRLFFERWTAAQSRLPMETRVDVLCVLGQFLIFRQGAASALVNAGEHTLLVFTLQMLQELSSFVVGQANPWAYAFPGDSFLEFPPHPDAASFNAVGLTPA